jgi:hypothetical protein
MVGHVVYHKAVFAHISPEREIACAIGQRNIHKNRIGALKHHVCVLNRHRLSIDYTTAYSLRLNHIQGA